MSRKRQRRFSPTHIEPVKLDLNSPPPSLNRNHPHNTAPAMMNKFSDFTSRINFSPIPFQTLLSQDTSMQPPPLNPNLNNAYPYPTPPPPPPPSSSNPSLVEADLNHTHLPPTLADQPSSHTPSASSLEDEIRATIEIGKCVGINLEGFESCVAELVQQNRDSNVPQ